MIDDLHGNAPCLWFGKWPRYVAVQTLPGFGVNLRFEGGFECLVGIVGPQEVGVAHEETFLVVVGINKPAGDTIWPG